MGPRRKEVKGAAARPEAKAAWGRPYPPGRSHAQGHRGDPAGLCGPFIRPGPGAAPHPHRSTPGRGRPFMPAYLVGHPVGLGVKMVSVFPANRDRGLPLIHALAVLADEASGRPRGSWRGHFLRPGGPGPPPGWPPTFWPAGMPEFWPWSGPGPRPRPRCWPSARCGRLRRSESIAGPGSGPRPWPSTCGRLGCRCPRPFGWWIRRPRRFGGPISWLPQPPPRFRFCRRGPLAGDPCQRHWGLYPRDPGAGDGHHPPGEGGG